MLGLGGSSVIQLGIAVRLHDQFSRQATVIQNAMTGLAGSASAARHQMQASYEAMGQVGYVMLGAGAAVTYGFKKAVDSAGDFQHKMNAVKAITGASAAQISKLSDIAFDISKRFPFMPQQIAEGILELVKAGVTVQQTPKVLEAFSAAAVAADEDFKTTTSRMIELMASWNLGADDAMHFADVMTKASNLSTVGFNDLYEAMKYAGPVMKTMKIPMEEAYAMLSAMGNAGYRGSIGGVSSANMIRYLARGLVRPTKNQKSALKEMGLSREDFMNSKTGAIDLLKTLKLLVERTKGMAPDKVSTLMSDLFSVRGARIQPLLEKLREGFDRIGMNMDDFTHELYYNSKGAALGVSGQMMESYENRLKSFMASFERFKISVGNALLPLLTLVVEGLTKLMNVFSMIANTWVGKLLIFATAIGGVSLLLTGAVNLLTRWAGLLALRQWAGVGGNLMFAARGLAGAGMGKWITSLFGGGQAAGAAGAAGGMTLMRKLGYLLSTLTGKTYMNDKGRLINTVLKPGQPVIAANTGTFGPGMERALVSLTKYGPTAVNIISKVALGFTVVSTALQLLGMSVTDSIKQIINWLSKPLQWLGIISKDPFSEKQIMRNTWHNNAQDFKVERSDYDASYFSSRFAKGNAYAEKASSAIINIHVDGKKAMSRLVDLKNEEEINAAGLI